MRRFLVLVGLLLVPLAARAATEVRVFDGATYVPNQTGFVDFGMTPRGTPVAKTFTVRNTGTETVALESLITVPAGFRLTQGFDTLTLAPGQSATFTVRLEADFTGGPRGITSFLYACPADHCTDTSQCPGGTQCVNGRCVPTGSSSSSNNCAYDFECPSGHCVGGACTPISSSAGSRQCTYDYECPSGQCTPDGQCTPVSSSSRASGRCDYDFECPSGHCVGGACTPLSSQSSRECTSDTQCPGGICTVDGRCVPVSSANSNSSMECEYDFQCPSGDCNPNGQCVPVSSSSHRSASSAGAEICTGLECSLGGDAACATFTGSDGLPMRCVADPTDLLCIRCVDRTANPSSRSGQSSSASSAACTTDTQCPGGHCDATGRCVPNSSMSSSNGGGICLGFECLFGGSQTCATFIGPDGLPMRCVEDATDLLCMRCVPSTTGSSGRSQGTGGSQSSSRSSAGAIITNLCSGNECAFLGGNELCAAQRDASGRPMRCAADPQSATCIKCVPGSGSASSAQSCQSNAQCPSGVCRDGICTGGSSSAGQCTSDNQCPSGRCDNGVCIDECRTNVECAVGICVRGLCVDTCSPEQQCPSGLCRNGECVTPCTTTSQCPSGVCRNGICFNECNSDQSCNGGMCRNGRCTTLGVCSNGSLDPGEECDDGNTRDLDGCSFDCKLENGTCGDGKVEVLLDEQCEPGLMNQSLPYTCDPKTCHFRSQFCGNGVVDAGEVCDNGLKNTDGPSASPPSDCRTDCSPVRCGDKVKDSGEQCDDGNRVPGDGCDRFCRREAGAANADGGLFGLDECTSNDQCVSGLCLNGHCAQCTDNAQCPSGQCVNGICTGRANGEACANGTECRSGMCENGRCTARPNGSACALNAQCLSNYCKDGICASPPTPGGPLNNSGPGAVAVMVGGAAVGIALMRRRKMAR